MFESQTWENFNASEYNREFLNSFYYEIGPDGLCRRKKLVVNEIESMEADYFGTAREEALIGVRWANFFANRIIGSVKKLHS